MNVEGYNKHIVIVMIVLCLVSVVVIPCENVEWCECTTKLTRGMSVGE